MKYDPEDWENYHKGMRYFNREKFYEAHEAWEEVWKRTADEQDKQFLQGLIRAAAYLVHVQKGNGQTASELYDKSAEKLQAFRRGYWGTNVDELLQGLQGIREKTARQEAVQIFPQIHFLKKTEPE